MVESVGVVLIPVAFVWLFGWWNDQIITEEAILGIGSAVGWMGIDVYYSFVGRVSKVYLVDAVLQFVFLCLWGLAMLR